MQRLPNFKWRSKDYVQLNFPCLTVYDCHTEAAIAVNSFAISICLCCVWRMAKFKWNLTFAFAILMPCTENHQRWGGGGRFQSGWVTTGSTPLSWEQEPEAIMGTDSPKLDSSWLEKGQVIFFFSLSSCSTAQFVRACTQDGLLLLDESSGAWCCYNSSTSWFDVHAEMPSFLSAQGRLVIFPWCLSSSRCFHRQKCRLPNAVCFLHNCV